MIPNDRSWSLALVHHDPLDLASEQLVRPNQAEVYRRRITGKLRNYQKSPFGNVVESVLEDAHLEDSDLSETDFKDCVFKRTQFERVKLDILSFATNTLFESAFVECTFSNSTFQNCSFRNVTFKACDFTKLLIKECRFEHCFFESCITSNKLFEMCFLVNCRFSHTDIQIDTILSNFGIRAIDLSECGIRSGRPGTDFDFVPISTVRQTADQLRDRAPSLVDFRLDYFENGTLLKESQGLDQALDLETWRTVSKNPTSFLEVYKGFSDFLILLYENDDLYLYEILRLHDLSGDFQSFAKTLPFEMGAMIMGVHQQLSIYVEDAFLLAEQIATERGTHINLLVNGPTDAAEVKEIFYPLFSRTEEPLITNLQPQNSPWQLSIDFLSQNNCVRALLLLLATRIKSKIVEIKGRPVKTSVTKTGTPRSLIEIGPIRDTSVTFGYGITVLLPKKRLLELQLALDTRTLSRMAAFLIALG